MLEEKIFIHHFMDNPLTRIFSLVVNLKPTLDSRVSALIYGKPGLKTRKLLKLENKILRTDNVHPAPQSLLSI